MNHGDFNRISNIFGVRILRALAPNMRSVIISPVSIMCGIVYAAAGVGDNYQKELGSILGFTDSLNMVSVIPENIPGLVVGIFIDNNFLIRPPYINILYGMKNVYFASIDMSDCQAAIKYNNELFASRTNIGQMILPELPALPEI